MSDIRQLASELEDLKRVRLNLMSYSHPIDLANAMAEALRHVGGMEVRDMAVKIIVDGLDELILNAKNRLKEELE